MSFRRSVNSYCVDFHNGIANRNQAPGRTKVTSCARAITQTNRNPQYQDSLSRATHTSGNYSWFLTVKCRLQPHRRLFWNYSDRETLRGSLSASISPASYNVINVCIHLSPTLSSVVPNTHLDPTHIVRQINMCFFYC